MKERFTALAAACLCLGSAAQAAPVEVPFVGNAVPGA